MHDNADARAATRKSDELPAIRELYKGNGACNRPWGTMRHHTLLRLMIKGGIAVGLGAMVGTSCVEVNYPTVAFRCNPRQTDNCPDTHFCCSDDPAAVGGALPNYMGKNISGSDAPFFSATNNQLGTSGMCVNRDDIPTGSGLVEPNALNCPIPCNPTWSRANIDIVCGATRVCCQTVEITERDCVNDGTFRPVTGMDIGPADEGGLTQWTPGQHDTHQDPNGIGCAQFAKGNKMSPEFQDCVSRLTVANQRGFCMSLGQNQACPTASEMYIDACEALNGGVAPG
jgi:hypothetical protein